MFSTSSADLIPIAFAAVGVVVVVRGLFAGVLIVGKSAWTAGTRVRTKRVAKRGALETRMDGLETRMEALESSVQRVIELLESRPERLAA